MVDVGLICYLFNDPNKCFTAITLVSRLNIHNAGMVKQALKSSFPT